MSEAASPFTGKPYGLSLVCRLWGAPRSSFYAERKKQDEGWRLVAHRKRGPKTTLSDKELLALIREDLEVSPFEGEGHRKVWARLRVTRGVRVGRKRVLRLMREAHLLSPHRSRPRNPNPHVGEIITREPNAMWGTTGPASLRWRRAGAGSSSPWSTGTRSVSAGTSPSGGIATPPLSRSPWG